MESDAKQLAAKHRRKIEDLLDQPRLLEALNALQDAAKELAPDLSNDVLVLRTRYRRYEKEILTGTDKLEEWNRIVVNLTNILTAVEQNANINPKYAIPEIENPKSIPGLKVKPTAQGVSASTSSALAACVSDVSEPIAGDLQEDLEDFHRAYWRRFRERKSENETVSFRCEGITKSYRGGNFKLGELTFDLCVGQITGVVGRNASGKTTLLRIVRGEIAPDTGVTLYPRLTRDGSGWAHIKRHIAYIPQFPSEWEGSLQQILAFTASAYGNRGRQGRKLVERYVQRYGLDGYQGTSWRHLSGGFRARFELVRALLSRPRLLVLDEPLAALDINARHEFIRDLRVIAQAVDEPVPVIITSQHIEEIEGLVDQIMVLDKGKCRFYGPLDKLETQFDKRLFLLFTGMRIKDLRAVISPSEMKILEITPGEYVAEFSSNLTKFEIMRTIIERVTDLVGFRDITSSTRRFFVERNESKYNDDF
jgi:ABC-2 type transport system ATP-binding protein